MDGHVSGTCGWVDGRWMNEWMYGNALVHIYAGWWMADALMDG